MLMALTEMELGILAMEQGQHLERGRVRSKCSNSFIRLVYASSVYRLKYVAPICCVMLPDSLS